MINIDSYCYEIELSILGSLAIYHEELFEKISLISQRDFHFEQCKGIFKIISESPKECGQAVIISKADEEQRKIIVQSLELACGLHQFNSTLNEFLSLSQKRRIKERLMGMVGESEVSLSDVEKLVEMEKQSSFLQGYSDKALSAFDNFDIDKKKEWINTGFGVIDLKLGGLRIPSVSIIGAAPSTGKTAFSLNVALKQKYPTVIFSLEMSSEMIIERLVSAGLKIDYGKIQQQKLENNEKSRIKEFIKELKNKNIYIFDDVYFVEEQSRIINELKPKFVVVDYIQKVKTQQKTDNRRNEIDYVSGQYKQISSFNKCHIMLLSQLSRADKNTPTMASLKESGALEADGDYVMLLHRPYVIDKISNKDKKGECSLLIDKNKFGGTGKVDLNFNGKYQIFEQIDTIHQPPPRKIKEEPIDESLYDLPF